jgi:hypothetical protein
VAAQIAARLPGTLELATLNLASPEAAPEG